MIESRCLHLLLADGSERDTSTAFFESYRRINQPRPEERALARVSKDGHKRDRASGHPSRRRFAPPQDEVCVYLRVSLRGTRAARLPARAVEKLRQLRAAFCI